jgi:hypothetical protein
MEEELEALRPVIVHMYIFGLLITGTYITGAFTCNFGLTIIYPNSLNSHYYVCFNLGPIQLGFTKAGSLR